MCQRSDQVRRLWSSVKGQVYSHQTKKKIKIKIAKNSNMHIYEFHFCHLIGYVISVIYMSLLCKKQGHNYTSTKSWRGYIFIAVCLSVCVLTKFQPNGCTDSDTVFAKWLLTPFEIGDLGSKVKVTVTQYPFFLHISLLTSGISTVYLSSLMSDQSEI